MAKQSPRAFAPPACPVSPFGTTFASPLDDPGGRDVALRVPSGRPQPPRESRSPAVSRSPRPHSPCSRFRFRSALGTTPPQTRFPAPLGAEPLDPSAQPLPPRVPKPLTPGTHPPLGTCWPPWPFPPPPPAAQRGPEGSRGQDSKRSPERGAGASQKSQSGPRSRRLRSLSRRGSSRPALSPPPL